VELAFGTIGAFFGVCLLVVAFAKGRKTIEEWQFRIIVAKNLVGANIVILLCAAQ
jgi:hypothetical protein